MIIKLKYGNTNAYFINGLLIDTDYAGTLPAFYKESKKKHQVKSVHCSDAIFRREPRLGYKTIDESNTAIISCEESRAFLNNMGINGEIIPTISHSDDGIAIILDDGNCCVGDIEPIDFIDAYENNQALQEDWKRILSYNPVVIHYSHANEKRMR